MFLQINSVMRWIEKPKPDSCLSFSKERYLNLTENIVTLEHNSIGVRILHVYINCGCRESHLGVGSGEIGLKCNSTRKVSLHKKCATSRHLSAS